MQVQPVCCARLTCDSSPARSPLHLGNRALADPTLITDVLVRARTLFAFIAFIAFTIIAGQTVGTHHIDIVSASATSVRLRLLDVLEAPVPPLLSFRLLHVSAGKGGGGAGGNSA